MNQEEFEKVFHYITGKCQHILVDRAKRYANNDDRLRNFTNVSQELGLTRKRIPTIFSAKQREAFMSALKTDGEFSMEIWEEWIVDQINYLILTFAIMKEESNGSASNK